MTSQYIEEPVVTAPDPIPAEPVEEPIEEPVPVEEAPEPVEAPAPVEAAVADVGPIIITDADAVATEQKVERAINGGITDEIVERKKIILQGIAASNMEKFELLQEKGYNIDADSVQGLRQKLMIETIFNVVVPEHLKISMWTEFEKTMSGNFDNMIKAVDELEANKRKEELLAGTGIPVPKEPAKE